MARRVTAYKDRAGKLHEEPDRATIADLAAVLGRVGGEIGMAEGIARKLLDDWDAFEGVMAEHRALAPAKKAQALRVVGKG